jgi:hypothetical protein
LALGLALALLAEPAIARICHDQPDASHTPRLMLAQAAPEPPLNRDERRLRRQRRWDPLQQMEPQEREQARQRFKRWREASPEQRERIRQRLKRFHNLPPEAQERLKRRREWFRSLPQEERLKIRERWRRTMPDDRRPLRGPPGEGWEDPPPGTGIGPE